MIIKPTDVMNSMKIYKDQNVQPKKVDTTKKNSHMRPDEVILSSKSTEMNGTVRQIRDASDVRPDKVAELKAKVDSGTYNVEAGMIAAKIIEAYKGEI